MLSFRKGGCLTLQSILEIYVQSLHAVGLTREQPCKACLAYRNGEAWRLDIRYKEQTISNFPDQNKFLKTF